MSPPAAPVRRDHGKRRAVGVPDGYRIPIILKHIKMGKYFLCIAMTDVHYQGLA
jgi:hypothetical protein